MRVTTLTLALIIGAVLPTARAQDGPGAERLEAQIRELRTALRERDERESSLAERIAWLEGQLDRGRDQAGRLEKAEEQLFEQRLEGGIGEVLSRLDAVEQSPAAGSALSLGGYFDIEFRDEQQADQPVFDQHRLILQFSGNIHEKVITFRSEIEIEGGGADVSFLSDNEILVEYAELHFHFDRAINLKAGALLVPFGRFNLLHDSPLRDLTDRPLVARRVIPTTWTDAGVGLYGAFDLPGVTIDYDVMIGNGLDDDFSNTPGGGFRDARSSFRSDNNQNKMIVGRLGIAPELDFLDTMLLGFSFGIGQYDDEDDQQITLLGLDWTIKKGPFELIGEWASFDLERGPDEIAAGVPGGASGYYLQLNFHFFPEGWRGTTPFFTDESTFTLVFRYGTVDTDDSSRGIDRALRGDGFRDDRQRYTFGINFRPIEKTVLKVEYQFFDETGGIDDSDNNRFVVSFATYF